ncbi:unnamed protein product [Didymodactylos carnosus]|uniref:Uncharacterized protein n=1 Tax=Didymodactylos carnosus TaxID=1234261 RepID=A0A8S2EYW6_9BILA|nr:unnamed protein product [Didymodactylos carnosus]CAF4081523.1 unnamed protein product [Didymodactylos carnosus]
MPRERSTRRGRRSATTTNSNNNNSNSVTIPANCFLPSSPPPSTFNSSIKSCSNELLTGGNSSSICYDDVWKISNRATSSTTNTNRLTGQRVRQKRSEYFDHINDICATSTAAMDSTLNRTKISNGTSEIRNEQGRVVVNPAVLRYLEQNRGTTYQRNSDNTPMELKSYISSASTTPAKLSSTNPTTVRGDLTQQSKKSSVTLTDIGYFDVIPNSSLFMENNINTSTVSPSIPPSHAFLDMFMSYSTNTAPSSSEISTKRATVDNNFYNNGKSQLPSSSTQYNQIYHSIASLMNAETFSTDFKNTENVFDRYIENYLVTVADTTALTTPIYLHYHHYSQQLQYDSLINTYEILEVDKLVQDDLFWDFCCSNDFITSSMLAEYILSKEKKMYSIK